MRIGRRRCRLRGSGHDPGGNGVQWLCAGDRVAGRRTLTKVSFIGVQEQGATGYAAADVGGAFAGQALDFAPTWATSGSVILQGVVGGDFEVGNVGPSQLYAAIENGVCARVLRPTEGAAYG
jgi:NitT/TauT family transport system substrate-binding protein